MALGALWREAVGRVNHGKGRRSPIVKISIFNDVIGPVLRGPSSSHCAAALRTGRLVRDLMEGEIAAVLVELDRAGSLPTVHESQGSDMGLCGGLLGWEATDDRLPDSVRWLRAASVDLRFAIVGVGDPHPNTYRLTLRNARGERSLVAVSTGGGMVEVIGVDGFLVSIGGDYFETLFFGDEEAATRAAERLGRTPDFVVLTHRQPGRSLVEVLGRDCVDEAVVARIRAEWPGVEARRLSPVPPVRSRPGLQVPFDTCARLIEYDAGRQIRLWRWAVACEMARGDLSEAEVLERMGEIVRVLRRSIAQCVEGTRHEGRLLGHQSGAFRRRVEEGLLAQAVAAASLRLEGVLKARMAVRCGGGCG